MGDVQRPVHRYTDGRGYSAAKGRSRSNDAGGEVVDARDWQRKMAVLDLEQERPTAAAFVKAVVRELRIRC